MTKHLDMMVENMRVLLVEDEPQAAQVLAKGLREHSYAVDVAGDGEAALFQVGTTDYDAMILDVMLPRASGLAVCRSIRESGSTLPILILTARDAVESRIDGLDCGADDYLIKPYDFGELLARLRAVIRRGPRPVLPERLTVGRLVIETRKHHVAADRQAHADQVPAHEGGVVVHLADDRIGLGLRHQHLAKRRVELV